MIHSERVLILAPAGRDGALAAELLKSAGFSGVVCASVEALAASLAEGAGAALVAEEAVHGADLRSLAAWIGGQPPWSDFPFVLMTYRTPERDERPTLARLTAIFSNVMLLERPFHASSLLNAVDNALRARRRQYQARTNLEALAESERRLSTALRAGRLGPWEFDIQTREFRPSDACKANFGRRPEDRFTYDDLRDAVAPEDRERRQRAVERSLASGIDYVIEYRCRWPDGSLHWVDMRARILYDRSGNPATMVGVSTNITERKLAEAERERLLGEIAIERERTAEALRGEKQLSGVLMTSVPAGIVAYDRSLRITEWNPEMARLFGIPLGAVLGRPLLEIVTPSTPELLAPRLREALAGAAGLPGELDLETAAGRLSLETQHAPLRGGDGAIIGGVAFFRDVSERRRAEEQLRQAQKMETIGQLTGGVAHDFNNLLAAVMGNIDLLRKRMPNDPTLQRLLDGAMQGAQRGASLTQRLLAFARRQDLTPVPTDLGQLLEGMRALMERSLGPQIAVELVLPAALPSATVDPNQLELAVLNLAVNARDAMPAGGTVTLEVSQRDGAGSGLGLTGRYLVLSVSDTGTGMDAKTLKSAIEPFFSTKELGKGTGLGLSMVHGLAMQLGGALELESTLGVGTTARLWLPASGAAVLPVAQPEEVTMDAPVSRILVVDDDALITMNTVDMIEDLGHQVVEAYSGKEALAILAADARIDALITDYAMPGMSGVELALQARVIRPNLPVLLATGYADLPNGTTTDLPRLAKPYQQRDLAQQLARLLGNSAPC